MTEIDVITAPADDLETVLHILRSARTSPSGGRISMWGNDFPDVVRDLPAGLIHLALLEGRPVATFALRWSDERVWGPDDGQAGYLHRLATRPEVAGQGIGARLIEAAADLTRDRGRSWLRLDCNRDNQRLRGYYEALGFTARRRRLRRAPHHATRIPVGQPVSAGGKPGLRPSMTYSRDDRS